jgi:hypothetical protein
MTIAQVLNELGITEYVLRSEPTNESEFNQYFFKVISVTENGHAIESNNPDDFGITWYEIENKKNELEAAEPLRLLRLERNRLLQETDWEITRGLEEGLNIDSLKTYRTALRNLPQQIEAGEITAPTLDDNGMLVFEHWPERTDA